MACLASWFCVVAAISSSAQTFTTLTSFDNTDGANPSGTLVQGFDGNFYGTTSDGASTAECAAVCGGTVFKVAAGGKLMTLHAFQGPDGGFPTAGLVQASNGNFYGTTLYGGNLTCYQPYGCGTIFEITPAGKLRTLHSFDGTDGEWPAGGLIQATDGNLYGTTEAGGASTKCAGGCGTVFRITVRGMLTTLHSFDGTDGWSPTARLLQGSNGDLYGTAQLGGDRTCNPGFGCGTIFEISPTDTLRKLYTFCSDTSVCTDGAFPSVGLLQASNGNFYGTTDGQAFSNYGFGTVYEITAESTLTTLHSFCDGPDCPDGFAPHGDLVQGTDGNFYGIAAGGGDPYGYGTVFEITPEGVLTTVHTFDGSDGASPSAGLVQGTDGNFYGTTFTSGASTKCGGGGCGTVFSVSVGLGPFVKTLPTSGNAGRCVSILGTDLTGTTSVTFNGAAAAFKVVSATEIMATVPAGATRGTVEVITPGGTLSSNVVFQVP
jgi:uncharacterized repeat protein (TIGR03803 family)